MSVQAHEEGKTSRKQKELMFLNHLFCARFYTKYIIKCNMSLWWDYFCHPHFIEEETKA